MGDVSEMSREKGSDWVASASDAPEALARWWAVKIGRPIWHDNGDKSEHGFMAGALMGIVASKDPDPDAASYDAFVIRLAGRIRESMSIGSRPWASIGTDYAPDRELGDSATEAGIPLSRFPWKTNTWATPDHVTVSDGYQGRQVLVWSSADWERPVCNQQKYTATPEALVYEPLACTLPMYHAEDHGAWEFSPLCAVCKEPETAYYHRPDSHTRHDFEPSGGRDHA